MTEEHESSNLLAPQPGPGPGGAGAAFAGATRADGHNPWALLFEHAPVALILVDEERRVLTLNREAALLAGPVPRDRLGQVAGVALGCANAEDHPDGCGHGQACQSCGFRRIISETFSTGQRKEQEEISACFGLGSGDSPRKLLVSAQRIEHGGQQRTLLAVQRMRDQAALPAPPPKQLG